MAHHTTILRAAVLTGSTRPGRRSPAVAAWVAAQPHAGIALEVVDLADLGLSLLDEPAPAISGRYAGAPTRAWARLAAGFDAYVLVTPEYNHSTSAALKNALDHLYVEWQDKPVGFVGYGVDGGARAVEHLRTIRAELGMAGVGPQVSLRLAEDFRDGRCAPRAACEQARERMVAAVARWAGALRPLRARDGGAPGSSGAGGQAGSGDGEADAASPDARPVLHRPRLEPAARAAVERLLADLQAGVDAADADRYDAAFAADVLWGSPYGATVSGAERLLPVHRRLMAAGAAPRSRFELVALRAPAAGVVVAQIRRRALDDGGFSELALYTLVERDGRWWLAAAQNTPIADPPAREAG